MVIVHLDNVSELMYVLNLGFVHIMELGRGAPADLKRQHVLHKKTVINVSYLEIHFGVRAPWSPLF